MDRLESAKTNPYEITAVPSDNAATVARWLQPTRILALLLAASGLVESRVAWIMPLLWPGYLVWIGWIAIASGYSRANRPWFWMSSLLWNLLITVILLSDTDWTFQNKAWIYVYARIHSIAACILSPIALVIVLRGERETSTLSEINAELQQ